MTLGRETTAVPRDERHCAAASVRRKLFSERYRARLRSERVYLAFAYGAPVLLAAICWIPSFILYEDRFLTPIASFNPLLAILVSALASLFRNQNGLPVRSSGARVLAGGIRGGIIYAIAWVATAILLMLIGAIWQMAFS